MTTEVGKLVRVLRPRPGVAVIELNDPARRNCLGAGMVEGLIAACDEVDADPTVAAAVLVGAGAYFCSGADTGDLAALRTGRTEDAVVSLASVYRAFERVQHMRVPTIAAVCGGAAGAGLNLALSCDVRLIAADAVLRSGFARLGAHPGGGHFALLTRTASPQTSAAMALFDEVIGGEQACALGLAFRALPAGEVLDAAIAMASRSASDPQLTRVALASYRAENAASSAQLSAALEIERWAQAWSFTRGKA